MIFNENFLKQAKFYIGFVPFLFQFNYTASLTILATNAEMFVRADNINNIAFFPPAEWNFLNMSIYEIYPKTMK